MRSIVCESRLDACGLSEVLFKGNSESAAQALVDEMEVERSEEAVVEESPKCLYQSGSEAEDTVQRIESPTRTRTRVLREKLGRKVDSKSIASSRPDRQAVLSQPEKRDDGHGTRSRVKSKEWEGPLAQVGETTGFKVACCEVAELESRSRRPAKDDQWQRGGCTMLMSVPWDTRGTTGESMAGNRRKHVTESFIQDEAPSGPVHLVASLRVTTKCQRRLELPMNSKRDRWKPSSSKSFEGFTIGW